MRNSLFCRRGRLFAPGLFLLLAVLVTGCKVGFDLDIKEAVFPSLQTLELGMGTARYGYDQIIALPDVYDSESVWTVVTVYNKDTAQELAINSIELDDPAGFTLDTEATSLNLAAASNTSFRIKYFPAEVGSVSRKLNIGYTQAGRERVFVVGLSGKRTANPLPVIEVRDGATVLTAGGSHVDLGTGVPARKSFTITNRGSEPLVLASITTSNTAFAIENAPAAFFSLASGSETSFTLTLPEQTTVQTADITIASNADNTKNFVVKVIGGSVTNMLELAGTSDTSEYDFGFASAATSSTLQFTNKGVAPVVLSTATFSGANADRFSAASVAGTSVAAGATVDLAVTYTPEDGAEAAAVLTLTDASGRSCAIALSGAHSSLRQSVKVTVGSETVTMSGRSVTLASARVGAASPDIVIKITNTDLSASVLINSITLVEQTPAGSFSLSNSWIGENIGKGDERSTTLTYSEAARASIGTYTATMRVHHTINGETKNFDVILNGKCEDKAIELRENGLVLTNDGTTIDFGYVSGGTSITKTFQIYNVGNEMLTLNPVTSSNSEKFSIVNGPSNGQTVAPGGSIAFEVRLVDSSAFVQGYITVVSNANTNSSFKINLCGGGASLLFSLASKVDYQVSGIGYDFGYQPNTLSRNLVLTNTAEVPFVLDTVQVANPSGGNRYSNTGFTNTSVDKTQNATITVQFSPDIDSWSEADLQLTCTKGRTATIRLIGSGFKQPNDIATPALWLRADRIASSHVIEGLNENELLVQTLPDSSGRNIHASNSASRGQRPVYEANGINGRPSVKFNGAQHLWVAHIVDATDVLIVDNANGTTTAVVFKTSTNVNATRTVIAAEGLTSYDYGFPRINFGIWYLNRFSGNYTQVTGSQQALYRFNIAWRGMGTNVDLNRSPTGSRDAPVLTNSLYSMVLWHDKTIAGPAADIGLWLNGAETGLGYLHSLSSTFTPPAAKSGVFGLPVGDGNGNRSSHAQTARTNFANTDGNWTAAATALGWVSPWTNISNVPLADRYYYDYANSLADGHAYFSNRLGTSTHYQTIKRLHIGAAPTASAAQTYFDGLIAEVIIYDSCLDPVNLTALNDYVTKKYGISP